MFGLFSFLRRHHEFLFFLCLSGLCLWFLYGGRHYISSWGFNTSHQWIGGVQLLRKDIASYFLLDVMNARLREENLYLQRHRYQRSRSWGRVGAYGSRAVLGPTGGSSLDSLYTLTQAQVINQTLGETQNFILLDKGLRDGIHPRMGVLGPVGIVGHVAKVSSHFSTVHSLLHRNMYVSVLLQRTHALASLHWDARSISHTKLEHILSHLSLKVGDTVITSGYGGIYPPQIPIGIVESYNPQMNTLFYKDVKVRLLLDYAVLDQVYIVRNRFRKERDSLEALMVR